jgi:2-oxo-3-hexenedioate decarboxylase
MVMSSPELHALALEMITARSTGQAIAVPPSIRVPGFDLTAGYAVEAELARMRRAAGHAPIGYKVGFANKAVWRLLGLETLVWAHMYDDTVVDASLPPASLSLGRMCSPKIEPEIVFTMKESPATEPGDPAALLAAVETVALGFEIIDCPYPDWKFQPADFVAAFGLHVALVVGEPRKVQQDDIAMLVEQLPRFKVRLMKNGDLVEEGCGRNALRSPVLCLGELASAMARHSRATPLAAGDRVSSGTLTESQPVAPGETWTAIVEGLDLPELTLRT